MSFFGMFKSSVERDVESKLRFTQSRHRVQRFVQRLGKTSSQYYDLARQAYRLGDDEQFRQLAAGYLQTRDTINRWERYLVRLKTLEMRRGEVEATSDFLTGINELTQSILRGSSPEDIQRMQLDVTRAIEKSETQSEMLSMTMDSMAGQIDGTESLDDGVLEQLTQSMGTSVGERETGSPVPATDNTGTNSDEQFERAVVALDLARRPG